MPVISEWPADCLLLIADQLPQTRDLSSLARTCQQLHSLINPYLYRRAIHSRGTTAALWWAIRIGNLTATRYAIEAGADLNAKDDGYGADCVLGRALQARHNARGMWCSRKDLGWKVNNGHVDKVLDEYRLLVLLLLDSGADIHGRSRHGWTPLHKAAWLPDEEMVRVLVGRGADVLSRSYDGTTALHLAAFSGDVGVIKFLLDSEKGVDIHAGKKDLRTPLHEAAEQGCCEAVSCLLDHGANIDARDDHGQTPLHAVVSSGIVRPIQRVVQLLIDKGANVEALDANGMTPLQRAVAFGYSEKIIDCLLENGADVEVTDRKGRNLHQLGRQHHHSRFARRFARRSARIRDRASR